MYKDGYMNDIFENYIEELSEHLQYVEDIHKLVSMLIKFCETHPDDNGMYEISGIALVIEEKLNNLGKDIYHDIHKYDHPLTEKELAEQIKLIRNTD